MNELPKLMEIAAEQEANGYEVRFYLTPPKGPKGDGWEALVPINNEWRKTIPSTAFGALIPYRRKREDMERWVSCGREEAEQYRCRSFNGSVGLESSWSEWRPLQGNFLTSHQSQYEFRRKKEKTYAQLQEESGIKAGDWVRVTKKIIPRGWRNVWSRCMDEFIGKEFRVKDIDAYGIRLDGDGGADCWWFPVTSLEKIDPPKPERPDWRLEGCEYVDIYSDEIFADDKGRLRLRNCGAIAVGFAVEGAPNIYPFPVVWKTRHNGILWAGKPRQDESDPVHATHVVFEGVEG
jgi:hypothetical protein